MPSDLETVESGFLIASPNLRDPNFDHTVVLMCMHGPEGAMGLVINRPSTVTMNEFMHQVGIPYAGKQSGPVLIGGPVGIESAMLLYQSESGVGAHDGELVVSDLLRLCPNQQILQDIADGKGPERFHVLLGHAGWSGGQLEQEIAQGAWIPTQLHLDVIFDTPIHDRWERALRADGLDPSGLGSFRPHH